MAVGQQLSLSFRRPQGKQRGSGGAVPAKPLPAEPVPVIVDGGDINRNRSNANNSDGDNSDNVDPVLKDDRSGSDVGLVQQNLITSQVPLWTRLKVRMTVSSTDVPISTDSRYK